MQTEKLYYAQPPLERFTGTVLACEAAKTGFEVVLDRTSFYPEGGGQPADGGTLGGLAVLDVQEKGGVITHTLAGPLPVGSEAEGRVDMERRLDHCQQHSGEHILSGLLHAMFGADNVGFHIGQGFVTMDTSQPIPDEGLAAAELAANRVIWQDVPVADVWYQKEQLAALTYRSKKELEGPVRIVTVPGADQCACCGTHVQHSGQVGMIKIIDWQKYKTGTRLFVVCGMRALADFEAKRAQCAAISATLSAKPDTLSEAVARQAAELEKARFRCIQAENQLFAALAAHVPPGDHPVLLCPDLDPDGVRRLAIALSERTQGICAAFTQNAQELLNYALVCAAPGGDVRGLCKALNEAFNGRGGGKPGFAQGSLAADFNTVKNFIKENSAT